MVYPSEESPRPPEWMPDRMEVVKQMMNVEALMADYGLQAAGHWIESYWDHGIPPAIIIPMNGGIGSLLCAAKGLTDEIALGNGITEGDFQSLLDHVHFADTLTDRLRLTSNNDICIEQPIIVLDDIADRLGTAAQIIEVLGPIHLVTPTMKRHTLALLPEINGLTTSTTTIVDNHWIYSGCWMNSGKDISDRNPEHLDELAVLQRTASVGLYHDTDMGEEPSFEDQIMFYDEHQLPWIKRDKNLLGSLQVIEAAKRTGNRALLQEASLVVLERIRHRQCSIFSSSVG